MAHLAQRPARLSIPGLLILAAALTTAACHKSEAPGTSAATTPETTSTAAPSGAPAAPAVPLKVVALSIGKSVGPDQKVIGGEADTFAPTDTVYAAVGTTGSSPGKLTARWASVSRSGAETPAGEETKSITPTGDATTEFHLAKTGGLAPSDYKIEILLDGQSVAVKAFRVAK